MRSRCSLKATRPPRRGAILLVVLAMLALFAVLGLSFALYAESSATAARINREAADLASSGRSDLSPTEFTAAASTALGQMLFDVPDTDPVLATSSLRGYGLIRLKYGFNRLLPADNAGLSPFAGSGLIPDNDPEDTTAPNQLSALPGLSGVVRSGIVNYAYQPGSTFVLDPEWTKFRTVTGNNLNTPPTTGATNSTYRNIAAPHTYPGMKDLLLAVVSAVKDTANPPQYDIGTILQPSYHRYGPVGPATAPAVMPAWVFNPGQNNPMLRLAPPQSVSPTSNNGQTAANDDWLTPAGRLKLLRPRPEDHKFDANDGRGLVSDFPYVPMNPDGTYTGDVHNFPSAGVQRNDSLWMYPAGPIVTVNNKQYTALVAPLVLDLGGRVNLSTAGNLLDTAAAPVSHASNSGIGRWEVNPRWVFEPTVATRTNLTPTSTTALTHLLATPTQFKEVGNDVAKSVPSRYSGLAGTNPVPADPVTLATSATFNGTGPLANLLIPPHYSRVDFDAIGTGTVAQPVGSQFSPFPAFDPNRYYDTTTIAQELSNHPAQFSPSFFPVNGAAGRTFAASDMRWLATQIAGKPEDPSNADVARLLAAQLIAGGNRYDTTKPPSSPQRFTATGTPTGTFNPNPYGPFGDAAQDPAMLTRLLVTTISNSTHRPELRVPALLPGGAFGTAPLGPVDLARPLPDYRFNPTPGAAPPDWNPDNVLTPDDPNQEAQVQAAQSARQRLARDIFVRLVAVYSDWQVGTGQAALIDGTEVVYVNDPAAPDYGHLRIAESLYTPEPESVKFQTLRQLAQLAVNLVDYVDTDDVSTPFLWNLPADTRFDSTGNYVSSGYTFSQPLEKHLVFGTELPRLVVNEVLCVVENKTGTQNDQNPTPPVETKFWVELHNPLNIPSTALDPSLSEGGKARLCYPANQPAIGNSRPENVTPYRIEVAETGDATVANLAEQKMAEAGNVLGNLSHGTAIPAVLQVGRKEVNDYVFAGDDGTSPFTGDEINLVYPAGETTRPTFRPNRGYYLIGPTDDIPGAAGTKAVLQLPDDSTTTPKAMMKIVASDATSGTITTTANKTYAVVLRRLANPYLPEQPLSIQALYNPYITVDMFDTVKVNDRADFEQGPTGAISRTPGATNDNAAKGRRHPYAGLATSTQDQTGGTPGNTLASDNNPPTTFMNWLAHLDRQPLNSLELASVSAVPPSRLTTSFAVLSGTNLVANRHTAEKLFMPIPRQTDQGGIAEGGLTRLVAGTPLIVGGELHKALDFLAVRNPVSTSAVGTPESGRVNINAVNHPSVLRALFDPNAANLFDESDIDSVTTPPPAPVSGTLVPGFWQKLTGRTSDTPPVNVSLSPSFPNLSQDAAQPDNPIQALSGAWPAGIPLPNQLAKTVFRRHDGIASQNPPLFFNPFQNAATQASAIPRETDYLPAAGVDHIAAKTEPLRKVWNNISTTSDTFLVIMTVGFFEVRHQDANGRVYLGKELYKDAPGDMRQKYVSILDRSGAAVELSSTSPPIRTPLQDARKPWFTVTTTDVVQGSFEASGMNPNAFGPMNPLVVEIEAKASQLQTGPAMSPVTEPTAVVFADGQEVNIIRFGSAAPTPPLPPATTPVTTSEIRLGFGDAVLNNGEGEAFTVMGVAPTTIPGRVRLTLQPTAITAGNATAIVRYHPAGSVVTNVLLGNPGPQPAFTPDPTGRYKSVVPYFGRINP